MRKKNRQKCPGISEIELSKNDLYFQNISPFSNSAGGLYVLVTQSCPTLCHPWTVAHQAPLSLEFPRQEYRSGLPFPSPGDLPNVGGGVEPRSPTLQADSLPSETPGKSCRLVACS